MYMIKPLTFCFLQFDTESQYGLPHVTEKQQLNNEYLFLAFCSPLKILKISLVFQTGTQHSMNYIWVLATYVLNSGVA